MENIGNIPNHQPLCQPEGFLSFKLFTLVDLGSLPESGDVICQQIATPMINSPTSNFDPSSLI
jgi:hypothetical protein